MKKWQKTLLICAVIVAAIGTGTFVAYDKISGYVADEILKSSIRNELNVLYDSGKITADKLKKPQTEDNDNKTEAETSKPENPVSNNGENVSDEILNDNKTDDKTGDKTGDNTGDKNPSLTPNSNQAQTQVPNKIVDTTIPKKDNSINKPTKPQISTEEKNTLIEDKVSEIVESISEKTKKEIIKMVTAKVSASEIQYFMAMFTDGLTVEEKIEGKEFVYGRFSKSEIATIQALYDKYIDELQQEN